MEQILSNQEILAAATEYNKWLKELTPSEIDLIKSMLNEARSAGYSEGWDSCDKEFGIS